MGQMDQNRRADLECSKINQNERNEMGWRELGHQNDPNGPKWIFKMSKMFFTHTQFFHSQLKFFSYQSKFFHSQTNFLTHN